MVCVVVGVAVEVVVVAVVGAVIGVIADGGVDAVAAGVCVAVRMRAVLGV